MTWTIAIGVSVLCLTTHIIAIRFLGDKFPSSFITPAYYVFAMLSLMLVALIERPKVSMAEISSFAVLVPLIIAGVTIGLTDFFFVKSLNLGAQASTIMPILLGGSTLIAAVLAVILFKETVNIQKMAGIAFAVLGIVLIHRSS